MSMQIGLAIDFRCDNHNTEILVPRQSIKMMINFVHMYYYRYTAPRHLLGYGAPNAIWSNTYDSSVFSANSQVYPRWQTLKVRLGVCNSYVAAV